MMNDENKMYLLKMKYSVIDVTQNKKNRKISRKKEKLYLVRDLSKIDEKLRELEDTLLEEQETSKKNLIGKAQDFLKHFGSLCNQTYYNVLRT